MALTFRNKHCKLLFVNTVREIFENLTWLTFENRVKYHTGILVYKTLNNQCPIYMKELITFAKNEKYFLRSSSKKDLEHIRARTQHLKHSFSYHSRLVWNALPDSIRSAPTLNTFKSRYRQHLLKKQT